MAVPKAWSGQSRMTSTHQKSRIVEGSCWTCRRLRVKCDLTKPICRRCSIANASCQYGPVPPVKWVGGTALRGRNAPTHSPDAAREMSQMQMSSTALVVPPSTLALSSEQLLVYFTNAVLPRFQLMEESLPLDLHAIRKDEPLQQAILAVAQAHHDMAVHATSNDSLVSRRQARYSAIQMLRKRLEVGVDTDTTAQQLFPVNVLLCMLDGMIEPTDADASVCHLKGGYALIQSNTQIPAEILGRGGLEAHLLSVFATMDLVHALLSGEKPYFDPCLWYMFSETPAWFGRLDQNDRFLTLLKTFSEMAALGHLIASQLPSEHGFRLVERCIPSIEYALSLSIPGKAPIAASHMAISAEDWKMFCDLYELSATIYMHRALRKSPINSRPVQIATRTGIEILFSKALPGMMAHCVIFPLLVIGAHAMDDQDREVVLQALSPSKDYLSFGNLEVMAELLNGLWANPQSDLHADWWDCFKPFSRTVFLF